MKVLIVMDSLFTGGAEYSTLWWMEWLRANGTEVKMVLLKIKKPSYELNDFQISPDDVVLLQPGNSISKYRQVKKIIQSYAPDIIHSVLNASNFLCRTLRLLHGGFVHIESLVNQPYSKERLADKNLSKRKIQLLQTFDRITEKKGVQYFHANSEAVADHYRTAVGVHAEKITVVPRGRSENKWLSKKGALRNQFNQEFQIPEDHLLLINTGRHEHQKGQDVLLEALHQLQTTVPHTLLIVGRSGRQSDTLHELAAIYKLNDHVRFLGHRQDVPQLLAAADLFVFPSRFEGMPGALIEACAAGLPIVCTDLPCMTEVVEAGNNALLFTINRADELSVQLKRMIEDRDLREKTGSKSLELFQQSFLSDFIHQRMYSFYNMVLENKRA